MNIDFRSEALSLKEVMIKRRRDFHKNPELSFEEHRTSDVISSVLIDLGLEVNKNVGKTGVVGLLKGRNEGKTILLRADIDALPIQEETDVSYASENPGVMHACGHDGHASYLLAVAEILARHRDRIHGSVVFVFQPAEEVLGGALAMIADGVLDDYVPDICLALHILNDLPIGRIEVPKGAATAAVSRFEIKITGEGGAGSTPHLNKDPIVTSGHLITALQTIVSRNLDPGQVGVVSVGSVHGGKAHNNIPNYVELRGTIRAFNDENQKYLEDRLQKISSSIAATFECVATVEVETSIYPLINDQIISDDIAAIAEKIVGEGNVGRNFRIYGGEDFTYFVRDIPGAYFYVGSANTEMGLDKPHHNSKFDFDESAMVTASQLMSEAVAKYLIP